MQRKIIIKVKSLDKCTSTDFITTECCN